MLQKQIDGSNSLECAANYESHGTHSYVRVTSEGLGEAAYITLPDSRSTSHSMSVSPEQWLNSLKKVHFNRLCSPHVNNRTVKFCLCKDSVECGTVHSPSGEHRWREYKLCDTLNMIKCDTIRDYLFSSFLPCIHAVQPGNTAQLWVGISDENHACIGIACPELEMIETNFTLAIDRFFGAVFPPIPAECVAIKVYNVTGDNPDDWGNGGKYYRAELTTEQAKQALRYFVGRCSILDSSEPDRRSVLVECSTYDIVTNLLTVDSLTLTSTDCHVTQLASQYINAVRQSKTYAPPDYLFNWICEENNFNIEIPSRVVVCVEVALHTDLYHCVCLDRELCDANHDDDESVLSCMQKHELEDISTKELLPARKVSPLQIWLRAKGLKDGALIGDLYSPLLSDEVIRVLVLRAEDKHYMSNVKSSLYEYVNDQPVTLDFCVHNSDEMRSLSEIMYRRHCDIVLITTWNSRILAQSVVHYLGSPDTIQTLMFTCLHDDLRVRNLLEVQDLNLQDIAVLSSLSDQGSVQMKELKGDIAQPFLTPIPASSDVALLSPNDILERLRRWCHGESSLSFVLLDARTIPITPQAMDVLNRLRCNIGRTVDIVRIYKKYPGSGATTVLLSVGWILSRNSEANVQILKTTPSSENLLQWLYSIQRGWVVLLVDDHIGALDTEIIDRAKLRVKLSIVYITLSESKAQITVNPILSCDFLSALCTQFYSVEAFAGAWSALRELVAYAKLHIDEKVNRHIYVVMHTATNGKFTPPKLFIENIYQRMTEFDRESILFLAFLSLYSGSFGPISVDSYDFDNLSAHALELTSYRKSCRCISFLHPCLAEVYVAHAHLNEEPKTSLRLLWCSVKSIMSRIRLTSSQFSLFYRSVFVETPQRPYTEFQTRCVEEKCDLDFIDEVFMSDPVKMYCQEFALISCSKVHRKLLHSERAVSLARCALASLQESEKYRDLAKSNLAETLGHYACEKMDERAFEEMKILFDDLVTRDENAASQRSKYENRYRSALVRVR